MQHELFRTFLCYERDSSHDKRPAGNNSAKGATICTIFDKIKWNNLYNTSERARDAGNVIGNGVIESVQCGIKLGMPSESEAEPTSHRTASLEDSLMRLADTLDQLNSAPRKNEWMRLAESVDKMMAITYVFIYCLSLVYLIVALSDHEWHGPLNTHKTLR